MLAKAVAVVPSYEEEHDTAAECFWTKVWINVCVKFVVEFFKFQSTETIEDPKFQFKSPDDPLNKDFYKIYDLWIHMNRWLTERSSPLVNTPIYLFMLMKVWLEKKGPKAA